MERNKLRDNINESELGMSDLLEDVNVFYSAQILRIVESFSNCRPRGLQILLDFENEQSDVAQFMAKKYISSFNSNSHNCYFNDRCFVANAFNLDSRIAKPLRREVIANSMAGYLENITHDGFHFGKQLVEMGAINDDIVFPDGEASDCYCSLSPERIKKMAKRFNIDKDDLENITVDVINWATYNLLYSASYYIEDTPKPNFNFSASTPIDLNDCKMLENAFVSKKGKSRLEYMSKINGKEDKLVSFVNEKTALRL